ncbi:phosphatidylinositol-binding clathrin assembly protein-like [Cynocephalus volans]|uniref:phosphatidylinositol-binding clathrin assembly protein-like n=1 Tax=Cynocephalus volans TaxID=110931 RepID=UPI002FCC17AB
MGSSTSKAALQATTKEPREPKPKHLAYLIQYINETNMSVQHLADVLYKKTRSSNWVVVFKALVTVHHLMVHGNERFIQHLASRPSFFTLHSFLDISIIEAYTMSAFIRRYSRYLNEKSLAYRLMASDVTKSKRGRDGVIRAMSTEQLLNTLPVIQTQLDALLNFNANPDELTNGIIRAAFMLLFRDALRLFAAYNEGILNLLDKFFDMRKNECKESLGIYINFLEKTTKLTQFLRVAEQVGIDQSNIPNLIQPPRSLLEALKQHLASLEEKNISPPCSMYRSKPSAQGKLFRSGPFKAAHHTCSWLPSLWHRYVDCARVKSKTTVAERERAGEAQAQPGSTQCWTLEARKQPHVVQIKQLQEAGPDLASTKRFVKEPVLAT